MSTFPTIVVPFEIGGVEPFVTLEWRCKCGNAWRFSGAVANAYRDAIATVQAHAVVCGQVRP